MAFPSPILGVSVHHRDRCPVTVAYRWSTVYTPFRIKIIDVEVIAHRRLAHIDEDRALARSRADNVRQTLEAQNRASDALAESGRCVVAVTVFDICPFYELTVRANNRGVCSEMTFSATGTAIDINILDPGPKKRLYWDPRSARSGSERIKKRSQASLLDLNQF